jgi:tetratricopeptide (TPR) repeat protein
LWCIETVVRSGDNRSHMWRKAAFLLLLVATPAWARDTAPVWVEVRSQHFSVATDAGEKQGRRVVDQFERMRWVFQKLFPKANVDPPSPIVVIAVKSQKDVQALEPEAYLAKGQLTLAGLFLRAPDKDYVLMRLGADGEHPYSTVYHEYTHLVLGSDGMPLWLNEGLAEFFQNTEIQDKHVMLGEPSPEDLLYLRQHSLIPLPVLFQVDANSPYYHEEQKGSVFYAEAWALTHYLEVTDFRDHTNRLGDYLRLVNQHVDPVTAAAQAFGDLKKLQAQLDDYTMHGRYMYFHMNSAGTSVDQSTVTVTPLTAPQTDALRADFLAYNGRIDDARGLLYGVLAADPNNVQAHETMGFIEFHQGHRAEAKKWYAEAVKLDSQSYLAQYYFASLSMMEGETDPTVESSLRAAIRLNPRFAPAYDSLAMLYSRRHANLDEAHLLALQAIQLDPGNVNYRLDTANILREQDRYEDSIQVLKSAAQVAKSPLEAAVVARVLKQVEEHQAEMEQHKGEGQAQVQTTVVTEGLGAGRVSSGPSEEQARPRHPTEAPHGRDLIVEGVIRDVRCSDPSVIELRVEASSGKTVSLYSNDAYKIDYRALNFTPTGEIHPCQDLTGMKARVHYFATADKTVDGQITIIALSK